MISNIALPVPILLARPAPDAIQIKEIYAGRPPRVSSTTSDHPGLGGTVKAHPAFPIASLHQTESSVPRR
jgi:hypothetical protein